MKLKLILLALLSIAPSFAFAQTVHSASLAWIQSTTSGVTSNGVYRAPGACPTTGTPTYTLLTNTASPATSYVDTTVVAATTYCYAVTASVGTEVSGYSVPATAIIPSTTNSPTNLTVTTAEFSFPALGLGEELDGNQIVEQVTVEIPAG